MGLTRHAGGRARFAEGSGCSLNRKSIVAAVLVLPRQAREPSNTPVRRSAPHRPFSCLKEQVSQVNPGSGSIMASDRNKFVNQLHQIGFLTAAIIAGGAAGIVNFVCPEGPGKFG